MKNKEKIDDIVEYLEQMDQQFEEDTGMTSDEFDQLLENEAMEVMRRN